jgi:hypothetical protein
MIDVEFYGSRDNMRRTNSLTARESEIMGHNNAQG